MYGLHTELHHRFTKTFQFPIVLREDLVEMGSWCPWLLPVHHQLQAAVLKNVLYPGHTFLNYTHRFTCSLTNALILLFSNVANEKQILSYRADTTSVCILKPCLHATVVVKFWFCKQSVVVFFRLERKSCFMYKNHVQAPLDIL